MEFTLPLIIPIPIALFGAWLSILLDGVERKIKARIQSRIGPPITQTLHDLLKLVEKEVKPIHTMPFVVFYVASSLVTLLGSIYLAHLYTLNNDYHTIALSLSLFVISLTTITLTPLLVPNPFTYTGGMREVVLALVNEAGFILSFALTIMSLNTVKTTWYAIIPLVFSTITLLVSGYALTGRVPFDMPEAEPEIASGILLEFSGKLLALYLLSNLMKKYTVKLVISSLFLAHILGAGYETLVYSIILTLVLWILYSTISVLLGRSRIDIAPKTLAKVYIALLMLSITGLLVITYVG